ncbi:MAG TPA: T9SS type A sorting domain-containing protein [Parasegetibacter sp.]
MKQFYPINAIKTIFVTLLALNFTLGSQAQCPAGAITSPTAWAQYGAGQVICISSNISTSFTLNSGASLIINAGGKVTGQITLNNGASLTVQNGGEVAATLYAYSGSSIYVHKGGKVKISTNIAASVSNYGTFEFTGGGFNVGASFINEGELISSVSFSNVNLTNAACGIINLKNAFQFNKTSTLTNNGTINAASSFTVNQNVQVENHGKIYVNGNFINSGRVINHNLIVAQGTGTFNSNDSLVNLNKMMFTGNLTTNGKVRNEGLIWTKGSMTLNNGFNQNLSTAMLRVDGGMTKNPNISLGGQLYIGGTANFNGTTTGISAANPLTINKSVNNAGSHVIVDPSMVVLDTTTFVNGIGQEATCFNVPAPAPLPVVFGKLEAYAKYNAVMIDWSTEAEINHSHFVVEYSTNGTSFTSLGEVKGKINSQTVNNYSFTHNNPSAGMNFYRLQIVSVDGDIEYSPVMKVNMKNGLSVNEIRTYPNPFIDRINADISLDSRENVVVRIIDVNGKVVFSSQKTLSAGKHTLEATNLSNLNKGIYILEIQAGNEKMIKKISK